MCESASFASPITSDVSPSPSLLTFSCALPPKSAQVQVAHTSRQRVIRVKDSPQRSSTSSFTAIDQFHRRSSPLDVPTIMRAYYCSITLSPSSSRLAPMLLSRPSTFP